MLAIAAALIFTLEPVLRGIAFYIGRPRGIDWYTWFVLDGLAAGCLLAILLRTRITRHQARLASLGILIVSVLMAALGAPFGILTRERLLGAALQFTTVHLFFAGILLMVLLAGSGHFRRIVNLKWLQFFGYISYGLYLVHMLVFRFWDSLVKTRLPDLEPRDHRFDLVLLRFASVLIVATLISYLSRKYYEEKFLRLKDKLQPNRRVELQTSLLPKTPSSSGAI